MSLKFKNLNKESKDVQEFLYKHTGIYLDTISKQSMIKNRLSSLCGELCFKDATNVEDILQIAASNANAMQLFINAFTTNKTDFFREIIHFQDLIDRALPELFRNQFKVKIYCSASSTGEEPYSIAASSRYVQDFLNATCNVEITASDIDTSVLQVAKNGIYEFDKNIKFPNWFQLDKYFNKLGNHKIQAKDELKNMIRFMQLNLFDHKYPFQPNEFDIIFCRNVLIYFTTKDQERILAQLFKHLKIGGTLYIGHAEEPLGLKSKLERLGNKTYIKVKH